MDDIVYYIKRAIELTKEIDGLSPTELVVNRICGLTGQVDDWVVEELERAKEFRLVEEPKIGRIRMVE